MDRVQRAHASAAFFIGLLKDVSTRELSGLHPRYMRRFMAHVSTLGAVSSLLLAAGVARAQNPAHAKPDETAQTESAETLKPTLVVNSEAMLAAVQTQDASALMKVAMPDLMIVAEPSALPATRAGAKQCVPGSYTVSDAQGRQTSAVSAVLVYHLQQTFVCNGVSLLVDGKATDNFVKQDGQWLVAIHTVSAVGR